jgi:hypothetical protein
MEKISLCYSIKGFRRIKEKGFTYDFNLHEDDIVKKPLSNCIYRYEGDSNPDDEAEWSTE